MTPRPYQFAIVQHMIEHPRCAVWAGMGLGKTYATLTFLECASLVHSTALPALVVAPLRVAGTTWPHEARTHAPSLRVKALTDVPTQRLGEVVATAHADVYTINYERLPMLVEQVGSRWPFRTIVADEATRLKGFRTRQGGRRARALATVAFTSERFIELTGTPAPNALLDLWGQMWFLDAGARLGKTYTAFVSRWFYQPPYLGARPIPRPGAAEEIMSRVSDICASWDARDWLPLHEPLVTTVKVTLPPAARAVYRSLHKEMYASLTSGGTLTPVNAAAMTMACHQVANGSVYHSDETPRRVEHLHDAKIDALREIIEEANGTPVLVAYHFRHDLARLQRAFPEGRALDTNPDTVRDWNEGKIPILFAHPASAGHGLNLQHGGNILVFFSLSWNLEERLQIIERIGPARQAQSGLDRRVFVYNIVAEDTIDEAMLQRVTSKKSTLDAIMEALKQGER